MDLIIPVRRLVMFIKASIKQRLSMGFNIPIIDWGRRKAGHNAAKVLQGLAETANQFDEIKIYQAVTTLMLKVPSLFTSAE
ncbi:MAG: hypothetical protein JWN76_575 [Chitinophagaceae bacterium]|nr:hypothetical protein [Chitinophagaceae bacterium]